MIPDADRGAPLDVGATLLAIIVGVILLSALMWAVSNERPPATEGYVMDEELRNQIIALTASCDRDIDFVLNMEEPFGHEDSAAKLDKVQRLAKIVQEKVEVLPPR